MSKIYQKTHPTGENAGFTLIELLVVVLIIGILSAIALPKYELAVEKARAAEPLSALKNLRDAQEIYYMANGSYATNLADLDITLPESKHFTYSISGTTSVFARSKKKSYLLAYRLSQRAGSPFSIACGTGASAGTADYEYARKICAALGADVSQLESDSDPRWAIVK